jgi:MinD superfamily P-loop ATPase
VAGVDAGFVVTEPTMSGIHDLKRALQLLEHFKVTPIVCVNMYDINAENTEKILSFCRENNIEVAGEVPFSPKVTEAMVNGQTIVEYAPESDAAKEIVAIWKKTCAFLDLKL